MQGSAALCTDGDEIAHIGAQDATRRCGDGATGVFSIFRLQLRSRISVIHICRMHAVLAVLLNAELARRLWRDRFALHKHSSMYGRELHACAAAP